MDTQDQGPDAIGAAMTEVIEETIATTGHLDYEQIIMALTKNLPAEPVVCGAMGIDDFTPELVLRHVIDDLVPLETRIWMTAGISTEAAMCFTEMMRTCKQQTAANTALANALVTQIRAACWLAWNETHTTDALAAGRMMLTSMPGLAGFLDGEASQFHLISIFADAYTHFLAEQPASLASAD